MLSFRLRSDLRDFDINRKHRPISKKKPPGKIPIPCKNSPYQKENSIASVNRQDYQDKHGRQKRVNSSITESAVSNDPAITPSPQSRKRRHSFIPIALKSISTPFPFASIFRKALKNPKLEVKTVKEVTRKELFTSALTNELICSDKPVVTAVNDDADSINLDAAHKVSDNFERKYLNLENPAKNLNDFPDILNSEMCDSEKAKHTNDYINISPTVTKRCTENIEELFRNTLQKNKSSTIASCDNLSLSYSNELTMNLPAESMIESHDKKENFQMCDAQKPLNLPEISKQFEKFSAVCSTKISVLPLAKEFAKLDAIRKADERKIEPLSFPAIKLLHSKGSTASISEANIITNEIAFQNENVTASASVFNIQETRKTSAVKLQKAISARNTIMPVANKDEDSFAIKLSKKRSSNHFHHVQEQIFDLSNEEDKKDQNIKQDVKHVLTLRPIIDKHEDSLFKIILISVICLCLQLLLKILKTFLKN